MTELTDRYVAATLRAIPEKQRPDIEAELRASIGDAVDARVEAGEDQDVAEKECSRTWVILIVLPLATRAGLPI